MPSSRPLAEPAVPAAGKPEGATSSGRGRILGPRTLNILRILLTALTLAVVVWYLRSRPSLDFSGFQLRWDNLAWAAALFPVLMALRTAKWQLLLRGPAPGITFRESLRSYLGPMALAMVTPGRVGELSRCLYLPHPAVQGWRGAGLVLIDSWTDFLGVLVWACLGLHLVFGWTGLLAGLALAAFFAPIPLWLRILPPLLAVLPARWGLRAWAIGAFPVSTDAPGRFVALAGVLAVAASGLEWLQLILILEGIFPQDLAFWSLGGAMALVALANTVQVTVAGMGVREGAAVFLLGAQGVGPEAAAAGAFLQSLLLLVVPALAGLAMVPVALADRADQAR